MAKVFVSYSRKDIEFAKRLTAELKKSDLDFWIDWEGIPPTVDWWKEIEKGIEEADIFLFLISPDSAKSKVCGQEIGTAVKNGKRIIPIVVREIEWQDTPPLLGHLNYIFFNRDDDFDTAVKKLLTAIQTDYEWTANHRRLQVKALEWERNNKENSYLLRGKDLQEAEFQLATNTSKEPYPTDLQREFVFASRKATDRQRRIATSLSITAAIALAALAIFGFYQANVANKQANIALSGKLAAQAEILLDKDLQKALLLGVESSHILETNNITIEPLTRGALLDLVNTNLQLFQYLSPGEQTNRIDFSPDGKTLASLNGNKIIFWNITSGKPISKIEITDALQVYSLAFSPTGKVIATGTCIELGNNGFECDKGKIILWDMETKRQTGQITSKNLTYENRILFSPDGKAIVEINTINLRSAHIAIWELQTGNVFYIPVPEDSIVTDVSFSPDGKTLAIGESVNHISLWDIENYRKIKSIGEPNKTAGRIFFSPDGKLLTTNSYLPTPVTKFWNIKTGELLDTYFGGTLYKVNDKENIQFTNNSGKITVWESFWDASNRREINNKQLDPFAYSGATSPDGRYLTQISDSGDILLWDTSIPKNQGNHQKLQTGEYPFNIAFRSDSETILSIGYGELFEWDVSSVNQPVSKKINDDYDMVLDISSDGKYFISDEYEENYVYAVRETKTGQLVTKLQTDQLPIDIAVLSNDNKSIATYSCTEYEDNNSQCKNGEINLWDAETGTRLEQQFKRNFTNITSLAFNPNGKFLAISDQKLINLWDLSTYQLSGLPLTADVNLILQILFSPDGKILAASATGRNSIDTVIVLWDVNTGQTIGQPLVGSPPFAFSSDGKILASISSNGEILLWDLYLQSWKTKACQRAGRNLTRVEWTQYLQNKPYPTDPKDATCPQWPLDQDEGVSIQAPVP